MCPRRRAIRASHDYDDITLHEQGVVIQSRGGRFETAAEVLPRVRSLIDPGDVILVKGSKGIKVSLVVDALRKLGQSGPTKAATKHMGTE